MPPSELEYWQFIAGHLRRDQLVMLLVVAESSGSSPGRQGYKMAVAADGDLYGSIGGGVMEVKLVNQSRNLLSEPGAVATGFGEPGKRSSFLQPQVHQKNSPNASGMICSGKQTIIFKLLTPDDAPDVHKVADSVEHHYQHTLHISPETFGIHETRIPDFQFTTVSDSDFDYKERLGHKNDLYIIGGGHCALALSELMSKMDFYIRIYDDRPLLNTLEKNRFADEKHIIENYEAVGEMIASEDAYVVVMTLGYKSDETVIRSFAGRCFRYLGVLGSKAKMATLMRDLKSQNIDEEFLNRIHTPIGLPINSRTPEEIAVSIAAEIISVKNSPTDQ